LEELDYVRNVPVFEMFIDRDPKLKDAFMRKLAGPLNKQNFHLVSFALTSKKAIPEKNRISLGMAVLDNKQKSYNSDDKYIVDGAIDVIFASKDGAYQSKIEEFFLSSQLAELPLSSFNEYSFIKEEKGVLLKSSPDFWNRLIDLNIQRINDIATKKNKSVDFISVSIPWKNVTRGIFYNEQVDKKEMLKRVGPALKEMIAGAADRYIKMKNKSMYASGIETDAQTVQIVEGALDMMGEWEKAEGKEILKAAFANLKVDVLSHPKNYPQEIRQKIRKLYGLEEEI
jgi:hypothetical protein